MIDFLEHQHTVTTHKRKRRIKAVGILCVILFVAVVVVRNVAALLYSPDTVEELLAYQDALTAQPQKGFMGYIKNIFVKPTKVLDGELNDRINVLLLGMGGEGHDGPYLTDTIILASIKPTTQQVAMISVPRDLAVDIPGSGIRKINAANSIGETNSPGNGAEFARGLIEQVMEEEIPYVVRINFNGFAKLIDELGGLDVYIERSFEDSSFPAENHEYKTISFQKGWEHMSGQRALDFVRSRHGTNGESSDFARARRQQKVVTALKDKLISFNTVINPARLKRIIDSLGNNISMNIKLWELIRFASFAQYFKDVQPITAVLDAGPEGLLSENVVDGSFLLFPKDSSYHEVRAFVDTVFEKQQSASVMASFDVPARIEIQNGTWSVGLAAQWKKNLEDNGIAVADVGNALERPRSETVIYTTNEKGATREAAEKLAGIFKATVRPLSGEGQFTALRNSLSSPLTDIVVILGQNAIQ